MILKRPSFRRGGNSGIAMLRQRYNRGGDQNFLNPGKPQTIQDFYQNRADKMKETQEFIGGILKAEPRGPGTYRGYNIPEQPQVIAEAVIQDQDTEVGNYPQDFPSQSEMALITQQKTKEKTKNNNGISSISLDPKEEIAKEAEFIKDLIRNENLTRGENALILAEAIGTPGSMSDKIKKAADLTLPIVRKRDKQDKAITLKAYELFKEKEREQAKRGKPTNELLNLKRKAQALFESGDPKYKGKNLREIENSLIKEAGYDTQITKMLVATGQPILQKLKKDKAALEKLLKDEKNLKKNKNNIKRLKDSISKELRELKSNQNIPGFELYYPPEVLTEFETILLAEGGRVNRALGTPKEEVKVSEKIVDTPGSPTPEKQVLQLSYAELRNKLPQEITDDIVELLAQSTEALQDFAYITTQDDVSNFNVKYGVNLVIPQRA